jgi:formate dehydrogenase subunit gamma
MAPDYVERFTRTERAVHWVHATAFLALLATGLALYLPSLSAAIGRRPLLKDLHVYTAVAWIAGLVLVVVLGDRRRLRQTLRELDRFDSDDVLWLQRYPRPQGRFNAGQKVNAALTAAFAVLFAVSGSLLWLGERDHRFQFASTILLHDWLTFISLVLLVGHLYLALIYPATRHSLRGITRGSVRRDWAERHHPKWARERQ